MNLRECEIGELFDLGHTLAKPYLLKFTYPWECVGGIGGFLLDTLSALGEDYECRGENVFVHRTAAIAPTAYLSGPCVIGAYADVRHGAFVRGNVLVGEGCVIGNSVELKNSILFDGVQVPHFNYVGDSVLGYRAHLGAGALLSNVKADRSDVEIALGGERTPTGRYKLGSFLGDGAEIGCNAVLCPGTVIGRGTTVYPLTVCRGGYSANSIVKQSGVVKKL